jgi:hypothetical protein
MRHLPRREAGPHPWGSAYPALWTIMVLDEICAKERRKTIFYPSGEKRKERRGKRGRMRREGGRTRELRTTVVSSCTAKC